MYFISEDGGREVEIEEDNPMVAFLVRGSCRNIFGFFPVPQLGTIGLDHRTDITTADGGIVL